MRYMPKEVRRFATILDLPLKTSAESVAATVPDRDAAFARTSKLSVTIKSRPLLSPKTALHRHDLFKDSSD